MTIIKQFFKYMKQFLELYPKVTCFHCGKRFRYGDGKNRVMHYIIPNRDLIFTLYFCNWKCHDHRIIDRSHRQYEQAIAEVRG